MSVMVTVRKGSKKQGRCVSWEELHMLRKVLNKERKRQKGVFTPVVGTIFRPRSRVILLEPPHGWWNWVLVVRRWSLAQ